MPVTDLSKLFKKSEYIKSFEWTGDVKHYPDMDIKGDTFPMTWGPDDKIYTSSGDPCWGESTDGLDIEVFEGSPEDYKITKVNEMHEFTGWGGNGPKPTGMICVNGIFYLAAQNVLRAKVPPFNTKSQHGSDVVIFYSTNWGGFWVPNINTIDSADKVHFPGHKFGGPSFIQFGKNNENARDEYVYAVSGDQWDNGTNLRLGRVRNDYIHLPEKWEFAAGWKIDGTPVWHCDLEESIPILSMNGLLGTPEMVYVKGINRYLLLSWSLHEDFSGSAGSDLVIFESPEPWGPFSIVYQEENWNSPEFNAYCPRIPLKWMAEDGLSGWLQCSGSWENQIPYYRSSVRPFKLELY